MSQQTPVRERARGASARMAVPPWVVVAAAVIVVAVAVTVIWRTVRPAVPSGSVQVDIARIRQSLHDDGFGSHGR